MHFLEIPHCLIFSEHYEISFGEYGLTSSCLTMFIHGSLRPGKPTASTQTFWECSDDSRDKELLYQYLIH